MYWCGINIHYNLKEIGNIISDMDIHISQGGKKIFEVYLRVSGYWKTWIKIHCTHETYINVVNQSQKIASSS